jgi:hypothetical protein
MDLAPNSTKSMECLKGYSAKPCFVLTRGVGGNYPPLSPITQRTGSFFFPHATRHLPRAEAARPFLSPAVREQYAAAALPSAGRPDRRRRRR